MSGMYECVVRVPVRFCVRAWMRWYSFIFVALTLWCPISFIIRILVCNLWKVYSCVYNAAWMLTWSVVEMENWTLVNVVTFMAVSVNTVGCQWQHSNIVREGILANQWNFVAIVIYYLFLLVCLIKAKLTAHCLKVWSRGENNNYGKCSLYISVKEELCNGFAILFNADSVNYMYL